MKIFLIQKRFYLFLGLFFSTSVLVASPYYPYPTIQNVSQTQASITFYSPFKSHSKVEYWKDDQVRYIMVSQEESKHHTFRLTDLSPNTTYYYRIYFYTYLPSPSFSFRTATGEDTFRFALIGDTGSFRPQQFMITETLKSYDFDFLLHMGDIIYPAGELKDYDFKYFIPFHPLLSSIPVFPTVGNHDAKTEGASPYLDIFDLPKNNPEQTELYYSFEWGNALFISLDSMVSPHTPGSPQYQWLEETLKTSHHIWKFVYFHVPIYSSKNKHPHKSFQENLVPLFERYRVDMVFSGHNHLYERTLPIQEFGGSPITYIISGGGGGKLENKKIDPKPFSAQLAIKNHFVLISIHGQDLKLQAIDAYHQTIDTFSYSK